MTPATIIREATADGVALALSPAGILRVGGDASAVNRWLPILRKLKPDILAALRDSWIENLREHYLERAAVLEYDGELHRAEAEEQARRSTALLARNLGAPWRALRAALGDMSLPDSDTPVDRLPYPLPEWCTSPDGQAVQQGAYRAQG